MCIASRAELTNMMYSTSEPWTIEQDEEELTLVHDGKQLWKDIKGVQEGV